ncbi:MAG TPA: MCP four helix bundle domain-containing protein, partial [Anaerolineae bacterium]|nr:MCP four helix bundle domain-containing protein [Anaerolineae bacterium]
MKFNNLRISSKIMTGYIVALILMVGVSGLAVVRLNQLSASISNLTDNLAEEQHLADQIATAISTARLYTVRYIRDPKPADLDHFNQTFDRLETLLATAERDITEPDRVEMRQSIARQVTAYHTAFTEIADLIQKRQKVLIEGLNTQALTAQEMLAQMQENAVAADNVARTHSAGLTNRAFYQMQLEVFKYLQTGDPRWAESFENHHASIFTLLRDLRTPDEEPAEKWHRQKTQVVIQDYYQNFESLRADFDRQNTLFSTRLNVLGPEILQTAQAMSESVSTDFEAARLEAEQ